MYKIIPSTDHQVLKSLSLVDVLKSLNNPIPNPDNPIPNNPIPNPECADPITEFAHWCRASGLPEPVYSTDPPGTSESTSSVSVLNHTLASAVGSSKAVADVEACKGALLALSAWARWLSLENDKFLRANAPLALVTSPSRLQLIDIEDPNGVTTMPHRVLQVACAALLVHVNGLANTEGGVIFLGVKADTEVRGLLLTRYQVDELVVMFTSLTKKWTPQLREGQISWKLWPVFSPEEINTGKLVTGLEILYAVQDPRGLVWPDGRRVVIGVSVRKDQPLHLMPHDHVAQPSPAANGAGDDPVALLRHADGRVLFLTQAEINELLGRKPVTRTG